MELNPVLVSIVSLTVSGFALLVALQRNRYMSKQLTLASILKMIDWMEEVRPNRLLLYEIGRSKKEYSKWSENEKQAAEAVARRYDMLGLLDSTGYLDKTLVDRFYGISAHKMWEICEPHIRGHQDKRGKWLFWEFEQLADRVKHVEKNHPAVRGRRKWPRNPRHLR